MNKTKNKVTEASKKAQLKYNQKNRAVIRLSASRKILPDIVSGLKNDELDEMIDDIEQILTALKNTKKQKKEQAT